MDHEIYLALVGLDEKIKALDEKFQYVYDVLVKKEMIKEEKQDAKETKKEQ